ncbi:MAG: restriction endonuclease subunit S [Cyanobacteria bacterium]|nr:restriction endonuclease subunit S [Cyanobacteriota bacterium]
MNAERLLAHFERISEAPDAIARLRRFILDLAVRGKLVEQDPEDEPAEEWLKILSSRSRKEGPKNQSKQPDSSVDSFIPHPRGWALASFNRVALIRSNLVDPALHPEKPHIAPDCIEGWTAKLMNFQTVGESGVTSPKHLFRPGVILYSKIRPNLAKAAKVDFGGLCSADMYPIESLIDRDYLLKYMTSGLFVEQATAGDNRVAMPKINQAALNQILVPVPPLAEQHRIVAKVDELMALCDQLETGRQVQEEGRERLMAATLQRLNQPAADPASFRQDASFALQVLPSLTTTPAQIKQLRQTILNLAVRGKLVEQDPEDEPAEELSRQISLERKWLVKTGAIPNVKPAVRDPARLMRDLPINWDQVALGDLCKLVTSGSRGWAEYYSETGVGFIRAQNIRFGRLLLGDMACVQLPPNSEGSRTKVEQADLLVVITGAGVTNPALLNQDVGEAYVSQHVGLIRPTDKSLSPWLLLCLMAPAGGRDELVQRAYGSGKPGLNLDNIRSLTIPLPPLAEQHRIVAKVNELMALCDQLEQQLCQADQQRRRLLEAVLAEALGGRLPTAQEESHAAVA